VDSFEGKRAVVTGGGSGMGRCHRPRRMDEASERRTGSRQPLTL
jgi:hypothetical protein